MKKEDYSKNKTRDLYMKKGVPCGDMEAMSGPGGPGGGPRVGGYDMGANNKYAKGIPNEGKESITAEVMKPEHKGNVKPSVLDTKENATWGGIITPQDMGVHHTFGV